MSDDFPFKILFTAILWVVALLLAAKRWSDSQGRIGGPLGILLGAVVLSAFVINPAYMTQELPQVATRGIDWVLEKAKA